MNSKAMAKRYALHTHINIHLTGTGGVYYTHWRKSGILLRASVVYIYIYVCVCVCVCYIYVIYICYIYMDDISEKKLGWNQK